MIMALFFAAVVGCQSQTLMKPDLSYEKELVMSEGNTKFVGFGVLPAKKSYQLKFEAANSAKTIRITNCHRDEKYHDQKKVFTYEFVPSQRIELGGDCVLSVSFLDANGRHQFGAISFVDDEMLPAKLECNGVSRNVVGASACQARTGTIQAIDFSVSVSGQTLTPGCSQPRGKNNGYEWDITITDNFCMYVFRTEDKDYHRFTTYGYSETDLK